MKFSLLIRLKLTVIICFLILFCQAQDQALYDYEGTYDFGNNEKITLGIFDEFNHSLVYLNLKTLKVGNLVPISKNSFREGNDSSLVFHFEGDKLLLSRENNTVATGNRIQPHSRETVRFKSGNNLLEGDLYLPIKKEKVPVVVFAHGSGPATRGVSFFTTYFLQLGIGVLTFDKQGAGKSQGDWETAGFEALSDDIVSAVNFIKTNTKIDREKIGILGNSQGGWTGTMAAAKSKDVSFLLMRVGSGQNVLETISHEYEGSFIAEGVSKTEVSEIVEMYRNHWKLAAQNKTWEEGNALLLNYKEKSWFPKIFPEPRTKSESSEKWWKWLGKNLYADNYTYLKKLKIPVLWQLAGKDWNVNSQKSAPRIKEALRLSKNKDYAVYIIPGMGHNGLVAKTGLPNDPVSWQYAAGFWERMTVWLQQHKLTGVAN